MITFVVVVFWGGENNGEIFSCGIINVGERIASYRTLRSLIDQDQIMLELHNFYLQKNEVDIC